MLTPSIRSCVLAACVLTLAAAPARAQYRPRAVATTLPGENYHVEFTAALWKPDAEVQITTGAAGTSVDLKRDLGVSDHKIGDFQLIIKPAAKHKIRVELLPINYTQTVVLKTDVIFNGQLHPAGTLVNSSFDWKAWRFTYEYDAVSTPRGFFGTILEVRYSDVKANITAASLVGAATETKTPVPGVGAIARIYLASNLSFTAELAGFSLPGNLIKSESGHYLDWDTYAMLNFADQLSVRGGYRKLSLDYTLTNDQGSFTFGGWYIGAAIRF
jgi:hypothetical protein